MIVETRPGVRDRPAPETGPPEPIWRLGVGQYQAMVRAGILTDDDPVELLEGWLVTKIPKNPPHRLSTQLIRERLERLVKPDWFVDAQEPITTADSEPEPDVVVVRGERRQYRDRHPSAEDVALVVEVSDTTLQRDRTLKKRLYARAGIAAYWIVNLTESRIEVYTDPSGPSEMPDYGTRRDYGPAEEVPVVVAGGEAGRVVVGELLP